VCEGGVCEGGRWGWCEVGRAHGSVDCSLTIPSWDSGRIDSHLAFGQGSSGRRSPHLVHPASVTVLWYPEVMGAEIRPLGPSSTLRHSITADISLIPILLPFPP